MEGHGRRANHGPSRLLVVAATALVLTACTSPGATAPGTSATASPASPSGPSSTTVVSDAPTPSETPTPTSSNSPSASAAAFLASGGRQCTRRDLRGQFQTGEEGAGNLLTTVVVGNTSGAACVLPGPVRLVGLDRSGRPVTERSSCDGFRLPGQPCVAPVVLPAHATFTDLTGIDIATPKYAVVVVVGFYRDDPQSPNGLCTPAHTTTPYTLRLSFGAVTLDVRNWDPSMTSAPRGIHAVFACHGFVHL